MKIILPSLKNFEQKDVQITQYPAMQYFMSLCLIGMSTYFLYSAAGGKNSIPGFNQNLWWQYLIAFIPIIFATIVIIVCQSQTICVSRRSNSVQIVKKRFFCFVTKKVSRQFDEINGISVVKKGIQNPNLPNRMYYIVISFKTCETYQILGCISSLSISGYLEELKAAFTEQDISQQRILIQNVDLAQ